MSNPTIETCPSSEQSKFINPKIDNPAGIEWVEIPEGEFLHHTLMRIKRKYLKVYEIGKYPVTNEQYKRFLDTNPSYRIPYDWDAKERSFPIGKEQYPVVDVSWQDAKQFCKWAKCRLPSNEEWEKAARGTDERIYPWGNNWIDGKFCNSRESGLLMRTPVDAYPGGVSPYGVWDMCGNVEEWTRIHEFYTEEWIYVRGGGYAYSKGKIAISYLEGNDPIGGYQTGLRCFRDKSS